MRGTNLGEFEELLLLIVMILQEDAYVLRIRDEINDQVNRSLSMGALHSTLTRLEQKEFLSSDMKGATKDRGGRRKRVYEITSKGHAALKEVKQLRNRLWGQVPGLYLEFHS